MLLQVLKALSLGCLGDVEPCLATAKMVLQSLKVPPSVRAWYAACPQMRGLVPVDVVSAFNQLVGPVLAPLKKSYARSAPSVKASIQAAHPYKFWGECPGGVRPWRPVVLSPTQFHRPTHVADAVHRMHEELSKPVEPVYCTEVRGLADPEHVNFETSPSLTFVTAGISSDTVRPGDKELASLFSSFGMLEFSPVAASKTSRR